MELLNEDTSVERLNTCGFKASEKEAGANDAAGSFYASICILGEAEMCKDVLSYTGNEHWQGMECMAFRRDALRELGRQFLRELCGIVIVPGACFTRGRSCFINAELYRRDPKVLVARLENQRFSVGARDVYNWTWENEAVALCRELSEGDDDRDAIMRLSRLYDEELFRFLYTEKYLYASRYVDYREEKLLRQAAEGMAEKCQQLESILESDDNVHWRILYAYLYLVDKVNEALYKLRTYSYRSFVALQSRLESLKQIRDGTEEILLLEANILRNTGSRTSKVREAFKRLEAAVSESVRYCALSALGELEMERADIIYQKYQESDDRCRRRTKLYEGAMVYFEKCLELNPGAFNVLYKIALQNERKGLTDQQFMKIAENKWQSLADMIEGIPISRRTTWEFEYLYKAYIRLGWVYRHQKKYERALVAFEKAEKMWSDFPVEGEDRGRQKYWLIWDIYGDGMAIEVLKRKFENRERVLAVNRDAIQKLMNER